MFGWLIKRGLKKRLAELEADPALKENWRKRYEQADIVRELSDNEAAIPFFDALARDFPTNRGALFLALESRLFQGDPDAIAELEELAGAHPSLSGRIYHTLGRYYLMNDNVEGVNRCYDLSMAGRDAEFRAGDEGKLMDAGGPVGPFDLDDASREELRGKLAKVKGISGLLAGTRTLDHGGYRQHVMVFELAPDGDPKRVDESFGDFLGDYGDTTVWPDQPQWLWLHEQLLAIPGSRILP